MKDCNTCRKFKKHAWCVKCEYEPKDLVDVVRCKDCVYREVKGEGMTHWFGCRIMEHNDDDWYCSFGERADT